MPNDRDQYTRKPPPAGVRAQISAAPVETFEENSGVITDPEERQRFRARRTEAERLTVVETKVDKHADLLGTMRSDLGEMKGSLSTLVSLQSAAEQREERREQRDLELAKLRASSRAKWWAGAFKVIAPLVAAAGLALGAYYGGRAAAPSVPHLPVGVSP